MIRPCYYNIEGFFPHTTGNKMGEYEFSIYLNPKIALRLRKFERTEKITEILQGDAKEIIRQSFQGQYDKKMNPYLFFDNGLLVQSCRVPGNSCDIGVDLEDIERLSEGGSGDLKFRPHNVDDFTQASTLMSIWLNWFNTVKLFVSEED
jgi:hypothetical protein